MPWLYTDNVVQEISGGVFLYDLSRIRGTNAILSRIPRISSGIYAWYRRFNFDSRAFDEPKIFVDVILEELYKAHCADREGQLPPMYRVLLKPETFFSKKDSLEKLSADKEFRRFILTLLDNSLVFQHPLYIGKAINFQDRIRSHLREGSKLRERLYSAGHNIDQCRLLLVETSSKSSVQTSENIDEIEPEVSETELEQLVEDILSRLFLPSFTLRYG